MGILRRFKEWRAARTQKVRTLGEHVRDTKRELEDSVKTFQELIKNKTFEEYQIPAHLFDLHKLLSSNMLVARESGVVADFVVALFRGSNSKKIRMLCAQLLMTLHNAKNPSVLSRLPNLVQAEKDPGVLHYFKNLPYFPNHKIPKTQ